MKFLLGTKQHMISVFDEKGVSHAATVVKASPNTVTMLRSKEKDGYSAVQVGFGTRSEKNTTKALKGHLKDLGTFATIKEFRADTEKDEAELVNLSRGTAVSVGTFAEGDEVVVSAVSKGKGFQGVVKRHKFKGDSRTHGRKHSERAPGSIGGGGRAGGRVVKGMRMAGRMGGDLVTIKGLTVLGVDAEQNELIISGAIPGRRGTLVSIRSTN